MFAGLADLLGDADHTALLLVGGSLGALLGVGLIRLPVRPPRHRDADILGGLTAAFVAAVIAAASMLLATGTVDTVDSALHEGAAAVTTTALSGLDVDTLDPGIQGFRASLQWLGGLAALLLGVAVLPSLGAGRDLADRVAGAGLRPLAPSGGKAARHILLIYVPSSVVLWAAYALAGIGIFDGLLMAMATVSTGGFVAAGDPLNDVAVQWIAIVGMTIAGTSLVILWRLAQGHVGGVLRSLELRIYLTLILATSALLVTNGGGGLDGLRRALFTAAAAASTTGFPIAGDGWVPLIPVVVLLITAVGGMAGSTAGGFHLLPLLALVRTSRRELMRQLHPSLVSRIRLGGRAVDEATVERMIVQQFLFVAVVATTILLAAIGGLEVFDAIGAAVHATATAGPARAVDGTVIEPSSWSRPVRLALVPAMIAGRMAIYPALMTFGVLVTVAGNRVRPRRRLRAFRERSR